LTSAISTFDTMSNEFCWAIREVNREP